jgi:selenocysteine-specific elongation factor
MRPVIMGTAGHIDHGKTTLVRALTGQDTDRLPEEKARGISIDLGFAHRTLPSGQPVAFVDVPGHERFIRNMVAGVHGMDAVVLVVAADEGVMPQTREHLSILTLLGVERGLTVLTKTDLVDDDWLDLVEADTREALAGTFLADRPMLRVSAATGAGLETLVAELDRLAAAVPPRDVSGFPRLPIDRVFTVKGFGTVVTGTLTSGRLHLDEAVAVLPEALAARIRGLEVHGVRVEEAQAGQRVAANLGGLERAAVRRGQVIALAGTLEATTVMAARLSLLETAAPLKHRARVHGHVGTQEVLARVYFFDRDELEPGETAFAELRWEAPVVAARGDRLLIRSYSPVTTIGGGVIAETGIHHRRREKSLADVLQAQLESDPAGLLAHALERRDAPVSAPEAARLAGVGEAALQDLVEESPDLVWVDGRRLVHRARRDRAADRVLAAIERYHQEHPLRTGLPREQLKAILTGWDPRSIAWLLAGMEEVRPNGDTVALASFQVILTPADTRRREFVLGRLLDEGLKPSEMSELLRQAGADDQRGRDLIQWLAETGVLVRIDEDLYVTRTAFDAAASAVREALEREGELGTSALREVLGTSRKYAVPILERLDEARITRRVGDGRVLGQGATS